MNFADKLFATLKSIAKIALGSRPVAGGKGDKGTIVIMGNGPSLADTIRSDRRLLEVYPTLAVNFAAIAPEFAELRPEYYVLADPHFFRDSAEGNLERLRSCLAAVNWPMTLFVPRAKRARAARLYANPNITLRVFNFVGAEGFGWFEKAVYSARLAMPRPRNVLVPSIMVAIAEGFSKIIIVGADHSWMKTIWVTTENEVVSVQPHFYNDSKAEENRIRHDYRNIKLHQVVESFAIAFKSYHSIANFAASKGVCILNATPDSFIDAFERRSAQKLLADYENSILH